MKNFFILSFFILSTSLFHVALAQEPQTCWESTKQNVKNVIIYSDILEKSGKVCDSFVATLGAAYPNYETTYHKISLGFDSGILVYLFIKHLTAKCTEDRVSFAAHKIIRNSLAFAAIFCTLVLSVVHLSDTEDPKLKEVHLVNAALRLLACLISTPWSKKETQNTEPARP